MNGKKQKFSVENDESKSLLDSSPSESSGKELGIHPTSTGIQRKSNAYVYPQSRIENGNEWGLPVEDKTHAYYSTIPTDKLKPSLDSNPSEVLIVSSGTYTKGSQSSWVTIFSLWNTMMGTSLLAMPWAISQAGFTCGVILMLSIGALSCYTTKLIVKFASRYNPEERATLEFSDICRTYLGRFGHWVAFLFSLCAILGGMIVFYVLMSNFLYNTGRFIHDKINPPNITKNISAGEVFCAADGMSEATEGHNGFYKYWNKQRTVPFFLMLLIFPLLNIKSPTFFTKFNALGTLTVLYVIIFVIYKSALWGLNVDFNHSSSSHYVAGKCEQKMKVWTITYRMSFMLLGVGRFCELEIEFSVDEKIV